MSLFSRLFGKGEADGPDGEGSAEGVAKNRCSNCRAELTEEFREKLANPFVAASRGYIDEVIRPRMTRAKLIAALASCENKRDKNPPRKHGNIPL